MAENSKKNGKGSEFFQFINTMSPLGKTIVGVGVLAVVVLVGYEAYSYIQNSAAQKKMLQAASDASQDSAKLTAAGINPSYLGAQYATWADEIKAALDYCGTGDYTATVTNIFSQMQNAQDVLLLIQAFGIRTMNPCWYSHPLNSLTSFFGSNFQGDLAWWLQNCL